MSNILKPLEYSASPVSGQMRNHRKSRRWIWITIGVLVLFGILGGVLVWNCGKKEVRGKSRLLTASNMVGIAPRCDEGQSRRNQSSPIIENVY